MTYSAIPYDLTQPSFEFNSHDELLTRARQRGIEEYSIENLDSPYPELFDALKVDQTTFPMWETLLNTVEPHDLPKLFYLAYFLGYTLHTLTDEGSWRDRATLYQGTLSDVARMLFDTRHGHKIPEHLHAYVDVDAYERDLSYSGYTEFTFNGQTYVASPSQTSTL